MNSKTKSATILVPILFELVLIVVLTTQTRSAVSQRDVTGSRWGWGSIGGSLGNGPREAEFHTQTDEETPTKPNEHIDEDYIDYTYTQNNDADINTGRNYDWNFFQQLLRVGQGWPGDASSSQEQGFTSVWGDEAAVDPQSTGHDAGHGNPFRTHHQSSTHVQHVPWHGWTSDEREGEEQTADVETVVDQGSGDEDTIILHEFQHNLTSKMCGACLEREEHRLARLETVKHQILDKLGLKAPPNITGFNIPPHIPPLEALLAQQDLMNMQSDSQDDYYEDDYHARTERAINFATLLPENLRDNNTKCCLFEFDAKMRRSTIDQAHLWVYVRPNPDSDDAYVWVNVYRIVPNWGDLEQRPHNRLLRRKKTQLNPVKGVWMNFDIKTIVRNWLAEPSTNHGLAIKAIGRQGQNLAVTTALTPAEEPQKPFLDIRPQDSGHSRRRRSLGLFCNEETSEHRCCRYDLEVDFENFGWDWIIAPKRYTANYCSGECPMVFLQKYAHTYLVQQVNPAGSAGPCCTPGKLSSLSMLYFDDQSNIIYGLVPGMIVDSCSCS